MAPTRSAPRLRHVLAVGTITILASVGITAPDTAALSTTPAAPPAAPPAGPPAGPHATVADTDTPPTGAVPHGTDGTDGTDGSTGTDAPGAGVSGSTGSGAPGAGGTRLESPSGTPRAPGDDLPGIQSVIGTDQRVRVNPTTVFPARAIVQIVRTTGGSAHGCTGWLYGPSIVATAGHCVHPGGGADGGGNKGYYPRADFRIIPGRNGTTAPYGTCTATELLSVNGWTHSGDETYDYAAIRLNCAAGNTTGWFGLWWQRATLTGRASTVGGYPCGKTVGQQWRHTGKTIRITHKRQVFYQNDTVGCQSGSPVYQTRATGSSFCAGPCVMAIHTNGSHGSAAHSANNHGTRITESVFKNLTTWRKTA